MTENRRAWSVEHGNALEVLRHLPAGSVHCVCTSPPYYGLRSYLPADHPDKPHEIGGESRPDCAGWATGQPCGCCYCCRMVAVFREVKRVLRPDGLCFINVADSYAGSGTGGKQGATSQRKGRANAVKQMRPPCLPGAKAKDLLMIPARLALALQADGWYLRAEITLTKIAPMPESVTDRPTRASERLYMLSASPRYFYDQEAERVPNTEGTVARLESGPIQRIGDGRKQQQLGQDHRGGPYCEANGRNLWDWWEWRPEPSGVKHFAVMPSFIPRRCFRLGASQHGCCPACGSPWVRVAEREAVHDSRPRPQERIRPDHGWGGLNETGSHTHLGTATNTIGWRPSCECPAADPIPCLVLDPFTGSGTCGIVARQLGLRFIGIELNREYCDLARKRIGGETPLFDQEPTE